MTVLVWIGVSLLGGVGALARFGLDTAISRPTRTGLPVGTLVVNLSGALALGLLDGLGVTGDGLLLAGTAALGSYTTFSTWMFESHRLGEDGRVGSGLANLATGLVAGLIAVVVGRALGQGL